MLNRIRESFNRLAGYTAIKSIENAFILLFPIILIGSFSVFLQSFPLQKYQAFIAGFQDGLISNFLAVMYNGTFGIFSIYIVAAIAYCSAQEKTKEANQWMEVTLTALACFMVMTQFSGGNIVGDISEKGSFTAIVCGLLSVKCYFRLKGRWKSKKRTLYADGTDIAFNNSLSLLLPTLLTVGVFTVVGMMITVVLGVDSLQTLFINCVDAIFEGIGRSFGSGLLYIFLSTLMWLFGLHGTNILERVAQTHFIPAGAMNQVITFGENGAEILTRPFFNYFVTLGGCGATICLLIAILIFSKRRGNRALSKVSLAPTLFNINELTMFGLPVVLNPILAIPFLLAPMVIFCIAYFVMWMEWVPLPIMIVEWTTPVILSGYLTTKSVSGAVLQLFCIAVGVLIYAPFVRLLDKDKEKDAKQRIEQLVELFKEAEGENREITLIGSQGSSGEIAKVLAMDLESAIRNGEVQLYYQPQFDNSNHCNGAEALLRWNHPVYGMIYPPVVIQIASETDQLNTLEHYIFTSAASKIATVREQGIIFPKLSVNISVSTLFHPEFIGFLRELVETYQIKRDTFCIEVTEQMTLTTQDEIEVCFQALKDLGFLIALDDFSMGYTSLKYLQRGQFDVVKLDGSLVRGLMENARCKDIISSIVHLSNSLDFAIVAEFVETKQQQQELAHIGCVNYQGYLYSPAVPLEQYLALLKREETLLNGETIM